MSATSPRRQALPRTLRLGWPDPLGATWDGAGTNFSVFSEHAEAIELCLFGDDGGETRLSLRPGAAHSCHAYAPAVGPGQLYGLRAHGPYDPARGLRFNPAKLLLDPYARAIDGEVRLDEQLFPYREGGDDLSPDARDDAAEM